jgi:hypothetical protein
MPVVIAGAATDSIARTTNPTNTTRRPVLITEPLKKKTSSISGILRGKPSKPILCIGQNTTLVPKISSITENLSIGSELVPPMIKHKTTKTPTNTPKTAPRLST